MPTSLAQAADAFYATGNQMLAGAPAAWARPVRLSGRRSSPPRSSARKLANGARCITTRIAS